MKITATITIDVPAHLVAFCKVDPHAPPHPTEFDALQTARAAMLHLLIEELGRSLQYNLYSDVIEMTRIRDYIVEHGDELLFTM